MFSPSAAGEDWDHHSRLRTFEPPSQQKRQANNPTIKIQKKGTVGLSRVSLSYVQTWEQLLDIITLLFPSSSSSGEQETPEIITFTGALLRSAADYAAVLQPDLHLLISYPSELSSRFDQLANDWSVDYDSYALAGVKPRSSSPPPPPKLATAPRCKLLPPSLWFYTPAEMGVMVTMENAGLPSPPPPRPAAGFARWKQKVATTTPDGVQQQQQPEVLKQQRQLCGQIMLQQVCVEFTAIPSTGGAAAVLGHIDSPQETRRNLGWELLPATPRAGEKRSYANYDTIADPSNIDGQGWWMASTALMDTGFSGEEEGERTFLLTGVEHVECFLTGFLTACGVGGVELKEFVAYWIEEIGPDVTTQTVVLLKFLSPGELRELLPLAISPRPHAIVRVFAVWRVLTLQEMRREGIVPSAVLERQVDIVLEGEKRCARECEHHGGCFRVFELGGARVLPEPEERREREMTPGLVMGDQGMEVWKDS